MKWFIFNDKMKKAGSLVTGADNRGLRYGDGLFETMKMINGKIRLTDLHFERLFSGLQRLQFETGKYFTPAILEEKIKELCKKNNCSELARVRLTVFRGDGGLYDEDPGKLNYIIQAGSLNPALQGLDEKGLDLGVYREVRKSCDPFSNIKSANYLPYVMAALYARKNQYNDSIVLNTYGRICDATIANVFVVRDKEIITPALTEGCVAGVMRRYLLSHLQGQGYTVSEGLITENELIHATEIFLTNAIYGLRWVRRIKDRELTNHTAISIFKKIILPLNNGL